MSATSLGISEKLEGLLSGEPPAEGYTPGMRKILWCAVFLTGCVASARADNDPTGRLGLGVELGEQNGASVKYWTTSNQAISGGLGFAASNDFGLHGEYLWHSRRLLPQPSRGDLALHAGLGGRLRDDEFGIRPSVGADYWIEEHPIELFLDLGPIFRLTPKRAVDFTALIGIRFYFARGGR
jgi:hypothetical protein